MRTRYTPARDFGCLWGVGFRSARPYLGTKTVGRLSLSNGRSRLRAVGLVAAGKQSNQFPSCRCLSCLPTYESCRTRAPRRTGQTSLAVLSFETLLLLAFYIETMQNVGVLSIWLTCTLRTEVAPSLLNLHLKYVSFLCCSTSVRALQFNCEPLVKGNCTPHSEFDAHDV